MKIEIESKNNNTKNYVHAWLKRNVKDAEDFKHNQEKIMQELSEELSLTCIYTQENSIILRDKIQ